MPLFLKRLGLLVAVTALLGGALPARAGFTVTLQEGSQTQTFNLTSGVLTTLGGISFGDYFVSISAMDSAPGINPIVGGAVVSQNTFTVQTNGNGAAGPLIITTKDDTFSSAPYVNDPQLLVNSLSSTLLLNGSIQASGFLDASSTPTLQLDGNIFTAVGVSNSSSVPRPSGSTFTMGNVATVSLGANGVANFTVTTVAPLPAPPTLIATLTGLPLVGAGYWLRRRKRA